MKDNKHNMILSRVSRRFEKMPIQINYNDDNMNQHIIKIMKDSHMKLTYYEHMMLECCFLFLCGFSFHEIGIKTHIYHKAVIKFLKNERLLELLSDEYLFLYKNNQYRLEMSNNENEMIQKAISTFVEQDGNLVKTCKILHIYPAIFRGYESNPDLEQIVGNDDLFYKYLLLRGIKNKSFKVETDREKYLRVIEELVELKPNNSEEQKYLNLAKSLLIRNLDSVDKIVYHTGMTRENVIFSLRNFSKFNSYFSKSIMGMLLMKSMIILDNDNCVITYDQFAQNVISDYMNSRYTYEELSDIFNCDEVDVKHIINKKSQELMSDSDYQTLLKHKKKNSYLRQRCPLGYYIVKDSKLISILKEDVIYVNEEQYQFLDILCECLEVYNRLYYYDVNQSFFSEIQYLKSSLEEVEDLFESHSFQAIKRTLDIEYLLFGKCGTEKKQYVMGVMKQFLKYDMDLEKTSEQLNIMIPTLIRILQDQIISVYYGTIIYQYIQGTIEDYRIRYKKRFEKENIDYTRVKILEENKKKQV